MMNAPKFLLVAVLLIAGVLQTNAQQAGRAPQAARTGVACADLTGLTFEGNTSITSATLVTDGTLVISPTVTATNLPPFCRVQGLSKPSNDSSIFFEVWLPQQDRWNTRFLSAGEGGFAGNPAYARNGLDGSMDELLRRGYATAGTDTGHKTGDASWAVGHPEKAIDYLYRAKHLVTVAAKGVIAAHYGEPARYSYFSSCSNGGRQGLIEAQRYPEDFDGFIIGAPWNFQSHSNAGFVWNAQALSAPGAAIPAAKLPAITAAAMAACDANDGLVDGIIADPRTCRFDPSVLTCKGTETDTCLTEPQVAALKKIYAGPKNPRTGEQIFPGFAVGSEASWTNLVANLNANGLANGYFANLVFENPKWDFGTFDFDADMKTADTKIGPLGNATSLDYSVAAKRGVKIIQYQGWNDQTLQPAYSPQYYDQLVKANGGLQSTQNFFRLYMVPGMTHCSGGPGAVNFGGTGQQIPPVRDALHDLQTALENWVERGAGPTEMIATKFTDEKATTRTIKYTRPLCLYPGVPQYRGTGDPNSAASFVCKLQGTPSSSATK
jgi:feruloyl esterase